ncbi:hypothetical protein BX616_010863 [Lobosporangium transversale]|uniref:GATA-type domain-containing protein n=1 Tax=Lobosporangium transversale TaxID=64571 RepID=A0A1Y2H480_9FUNG|nr:hypothetical protein BCR41DRAFT_344078 [Lobosporangium transversale]KAF9917917.1 hypothetical protein BX616_010863 [Lobosporangium transversale]ORZ28791.1 hypothetical protein BCR41DRAFT_344078 [Lobosporangium transversale]|eukprot:XP_021886464.1 hypothetical protein BCR41DRAFT_344078 [Lobosporangium transversale]
MTNSSTLQRTLATPPRNKQTTEAIKASKVIYPTSLQPDAMDRVPTMSVADSVLLQATLKQSRHTWTHTAFARFTPESAVRGPGGKKYVSEVTPVGLCTVCIGPHMFLDTKFFTVYNPSPPTPSSPPPATAALSTTTDAIALPTEEFPQSSSTLTNIVPTGTTGTTAPEGMDGLIEAQPGNLSAQEKLSESVSDTLMDGDMDIDNKSTNISLADDSKSQPVVVHHLQSAETCTPSIPVVAMEDDTLQGKSLIEPAEKPSTTTPTSIDAKAKTPAAKPQRPMYQVIFEFRENPGVRWLFPHESSLEFTSIEGCDTAKISASFWLPTTEESCAGAYGLGSGSETASRSGQATTVVILQATNELWVGLQQSISDPALTYRLMLEKMKSIPPRTYVQYNLPLDFPDDQLQHKGFKKLSDHHVDPLKKFEPSKRKPDDIVEQQTFGKTKRSKAELDQVGPFSHKNAMTTKKNTQTTSAGSSNAASSSVSHQKQCAYCGVTSTPTWRRGPEGPHTLCNACGVKWRQGKIFINPGEKPGLAQTPGTTSVSTPAPLPVSRKLPPPPPQPTPLALQKIPTTTLSVTILPPDSLTTTAEAAVRMQQGLVRHAEQLLFVDNPGTETELRPEPKMSSKRASSTIRKQNSSALSTDGKMLKTVYGETTSSGKKRSISKGPKMVPINQIGESSKPHGKIVASSKKDKDRDKSKEKEKDKEKEKAKAKEKLKSKPKQKECEKNIVIEVPAPQSKATEAAISLAMGSPNKTMSAQITGTTSSTTCLADPTSDKILSEPASILVATPTPIPAATQTMAHKPGTTITSNISNPNPLTIGTTSQSTVKSPLAMSAATKLSILKSLASNPRYQVGHDAAVSTVSLIDEGLSLYATKNLYTNNTATFPLHFPTISIAFGPNNAYYMYPNCAVVLFENHFQIKLIHSGERADIDVWKENVEKSEFQVVDVGDESMIIMKAVLSQHLSRFNKDLLNPDKNETSIVFRFRERLDGGGPPVKPLLEQWLTTKIPEAVPLASKVSVAASKK